MPSFILGQIDDFYKFPVENDVISPMLNAYGILMAIAIPVLLFLILYSILYKRQFNQNDDDFILVINPYFILILGFFAFIHFILLFASGDVSFFLNTLFSGSISSDDYSDLRVRLIEDGFKKFQSSSFVNYLKFIVSSATIFSFFLFLYVSRFNKGLLLRHILIFSLISFNMFITSFKGFEKGPILLFLGISFAIIFQRKLKSIGFIRILGIIVLANLLVTQIVAFTTGLTFLDAFIFMYFRIFLEPTVCSYMHFAVFPNNIDFVNFSNMGIVRLLFNQPEVLQSGSIPIDVAVSFTGLYYSANANIVPMGWAQSGYNGVIIYSVLTLLSFLVVDIHSIYTGNKKILGMLNYFYAYFLLYFANTSIENFISSSCFFLWPLILPYVLRERSITHTA